MAESFDILQYVKDALGMNGNSFHDVTLLSYISETKEFMIDAGVSVAVVESQHSAGIIARGVSDLWNYGSGGTGFSPYFYQRVTQLCYKEVSNNA